MNFQDIETLADDIQDVEEFLLVEFVNELLEEGDSDE